VEIQRPFVVVVVAVRPWPPLRRPHPKRPHFAVPVHAEVQAPLAAAASTTAAATTSGAGRRTGTDWVIVRGPRILPAVVDVVEARHRVVSECTLNQ